jgi:hypothetical protein
VVTRAYVSRAHVTREHVTRVLVVWVPPLLVGVVAFIAARLALMPGLGFWDTAELQAVAPVLGTAHPTGFPTYVLLGWLASLVLTPFGEPALRMNLFAALSVAVAAAVTVDLVRALTRSLPLGILAGLGLAFTALVWSIGTHAEAHALHLALVAILFRLLIAWEDGGRDRSLIAAAVVFGLAVGNHSLTLLLAPPIALYVLAVDRDILHRPRFIAGCAGALAITLVLVYLELPLRAGPFRAPLVYGDPSTWDGFWYVALAEQFRGSVVGPFDDLPGKFRSLVDLTIGQFGPLTALLPLAFVATAVQRPRYALLSGTTVLITCFFAASYVNAMIDRYYLGPVLIAWTWIALLVGGVAGLFGDLVDGRRRPSAVVATVLAVLLLVPTVAGLSDRYRAVDRSRDVAAREWLEHALATVEPGGLVLSWWSYSTPLWYAQAVEGRRPDIDIIDDRTRLDRNLGDIYDVIDANLPTRPVYVIRIEPDEILGLRDRYELDGNAFSALTRVLGRREPAE